MARWFLILVLFFSFSTYADSNTLATNIQMCLAGTSNTSKAACIQTAVSNEEANQVTTLFQMYANFVNQEIKSNTYGASQNGAQPQLTSGQQAAPPQVKGTPVQPAQPIQPPSPPPPVAQPAKPAPQGQGGIQYY